MCFFFKQKTAYEVRISDWSSDVCSADLARATSSAMSCCSRAAEMLARLPVPARPAMTSKPPPGSAATADRKRDVEGQSVFVRVDLGDRRLIKKNKKKTTP